MCNILNYIIEQPFLNRRTLAEMSVTLLGTIKYINDYMQLIDKAKKEISYKKPKNAIILVAGFE